MASGSRPKKRSFWRLGFLSLYSLGLVGWLLSAYGDEAKDGTTELQAQVQRMGLSRGICVFLGLPETGKADSIVSLAQANELLCYVQSASPEEVAAIRQAAKSAGLLGKKIWADDGSWQHIQLADNLADAVFVGPSARKMDGTPRQ